MNSMTKLKELPHGILCSKTRLYAARSKGSDRVLVLSAMHQLSDFNQKLFVPGFAKRST